MSSNPFGNPSAEERRQSTPDWRMRSNATSTKETRSKRSGFNTSLEISKYEQLNKEALVKVYKLEDKEL